IARAVLPLCPEQVAHASHYAVASRFLGGQQPEDGPGGLRRSAWPHAFRTGIVVRSAGFAPSTIRVLDHAEPLRGLLNIGLVMVNLHRLQPAQHLHGSVDVVHAPTPEQSPIRLFLVANEAVPVLYRGTVL